MEHDNQQHDSEIVGLHSPDKGCSYNMHDCCGRHVVPGHGKVQKGKVVYQTPGDPDSDVHIKTVIKVILILDGAEQCTIGSTHSWSQPLL
jgi:hypothetical protein